MKYIRILLLFFTVSMLIASAVYFMMPENRTWLEEDRLIENLTGFLFFVTFLLGLIFALKGNPQRKALIFLSIAGLICLFEELSFGERLFGFRMPEIMGFKIDALHDLLSVEKSLGGNFIRNNSQLIFPLLVITVLLTILIILLLIKYKNSIKKTALSIYQKPPVMLALIFAALTVFALISDLEIVHINLMLAEEMFELNAAFALILCCISLLNIPKPVQ